MKDFVMFMGYWFILISSVSVIGISTGIVLNYMYRKLQDAYNFYELSKAVQEYKKKKAEVAE